MPQGHETDQAALVDEVFSDYSELKKDLPPENQPYLVSQREVKVCCVHDFDVVSELGIESKSLPVHPFSDEAFFRLLPGFLGVSDCEVTLSVSKSEFTHLDSEFLPEFGGVEAMLVSPQEMHRFLQQADPNEEYFFYLMHTDGGVRRIDVHLERDKWYFMPWDLDEAPTLDYELMVHRKKKE